MIVSVVVEMYEIAVNSVIIFVFLIKRDVARFEGSEIIEIFIEVVVELFAIEVDFVFKSTSRIFWHGHRRYYALCSHYT